jgi:molybdopterin molybdotransferase
MKTLADIADSLAGYDPQALPADAVQAFLTQLAQPLTHSEPVALMQALDRVLAQDVVSPIDVPAHDNSAMDGYAFAGAALDTAADTLALHCVGTAMAGRAWQGTVLPGQCVHVMTGALMPEGLDTVVPQEFTQIDGDVVYFSSRILRLGDNRRLRGEDLCQGRASLLKGELLTPASLGLAASLGLETLEVWRRLKVAYFSTGDEILSLGQAPREGTVFDSNRYTVLGLLRRLGCEVLDLGVVRDDPAALRAAFVQAAAQADAIITSGGVSVGEADHTKAMMRELGDVAFWRIAMRPGRPMAVGRLFAAKLASSEKETSAEHSQNKSNDGRPVVLFGLPGNPVAVMVTFLAFVRPALQRMMGMTPRPQPLLQARSLERLRKKPGRTEYQRGLVRHGPDGTLEVAATGNQGSGVLSSMVQANGLIVLHHEQGNVEPGDRVDVMMFDGAMGPA